MSSDLIVRLPNHLGDACMALPALDLLAARGRALTLARRPWAAVTDAIAEAEAAAAAAHVYLSE